MNYSVEKQKEEDNACTHAKIKASNHNHQKPLSRFSLSKGTNLVSKNSRSRGTQLYELRFSLSILLTMRVPVNPPQTNQSQNPKPVPCNNTGQNIGLHSPNTNTPNLCYEPTSVLDLCQSPSPATKRPALATEISTHPGVLPRPEDPLDLIG